MEFSSNVLIDFGLNLAGYLVAAVLAYLLIGRRHRETAQEPAVEAKPDEKPVATKPSSAVPEATRQKPGPEFVQLTLNRTTPATATGNRLTPESARHIADEEGGADWRRRNRRAIYEEARRLLAGGASRNDLLTSLPVTESELDMLKVTGKA